MADDTMAAGDDKVRRPFADWLLEQRQGVLHAELTEALNELVQSVNEHAKAGELTLKIKVKPATKSTMGALVVADDVAVKKPVGDRAEALYFVDRHSNLSRENPQQPRLPLREVGDDQPAAAPTHAQEA